ncbi:MAG: bifunctional phosphoribosylaminoimidazolecarboxamide formyltransferase/IMP cyclohydrolase [Candidatus Levyibacteriota bacterium]
MQKYALLSVFDKKGIVDFARILIQLDYKIISTGGTGKALQEAKIPYIPIQEITGSPESFDGRMKTISFQIESGILFDRSNPKHVKEAEELKIKPVNIVACNLYPFEETLKKNLSENEAIENIDVGGPTMVRAAAKNFKNVVVIVDPSDYEEVGKKLSEKNVTEELRKHLAGKAFNHLSFYDSQVAAYLRDETFPEELTLAGRKIINLRYGENPHQKGAFYAMPNVISSLQHLTKQWGRELSLINLTDINAGLESVRLFDTFAAAVIKHNSPSGISLGKDAKEALELAIAADPESAFGGIIVLNREMNLDAAKVIGEFKDERQGNIDIVAVPSITADALEFLQNVRKSMGIYTFGDIPKKLDAFNIKWVDNGFVYQTADVDVEKGFEKWEVVTKKKPSEKQMEQMQIAWKFVTRIHSNSVLVVDKTLPMTRGIGSGQTSRIRSTKIALEQAGTYAIDGILASDSFFPFGDSVKLAADHGITAIVQQGGSVRDADSIAEADKAGICMIFTHRRAFWH